MCIGKKTLIASAVLLGLGLAGQAFAQASNTEDGPGSNIQIAVDDDSDNSDNSTHDGDNRDNILSWKE